jgi:hypothetical protein
VRACDRVVFRPRALLVCGALLTHSLMFFAISLLFWLAGWVYVCVHMTGDHETKVVFSWTSV